MFVIMSTSPENSTVTLKMRDGTTSGDVEGGGEDTRNRNFLEYEEDDEEMEDDKEEEDEENKLLVSC